MLQGNDLRRTTKKRGAGYYRPPFSPFMCECGLHHAAHTAHATHATHAAHATWH